MSDELPEGWAARLLPEVFDLNPPKPAADALSEEAEVSFVPMPAVNATLGTITDATPRRFGDVRKGYTGFTNDDVILAKITPCFENGKAAVARSLINGLGFGSSEFFVFRSKGAVLPEYLFHYVRQRRFRDEGAEHMNGAVGQARVPSDFLKAVELPVAPLPEQRRIVAKVEALLEQVNRAKGRLDRVPQILKRFRQAVLAAACSGELTREWRGQVDVNWPEVTMDAVCASITDGDHQAPPKASSGVPFITISAMNDGELRLEQATRFVPQDYFAALKAERRPAVGDILFSVTGSIGIAALVNIASPFVFQRHIAILKPDRRQIASKFLRYRLEAKDIQKQGEDVATGTAQLTIPLGGLRSFTFLLPPLEEQAEIVRQVERLFALADTIEARVKAATARADKLPQAILSKAFSGELVPTEAELARAEGRSYETAEQLLQRVQGAKAKAPAKKPKRGTR